MPPTVERLSVHAAGVALVAAAFVFGVFALTAALAQVVGAPSAFAIVAFMLALAGGGLMVGARQRPQSQPPPPRPHSVESALVELVIVAAKEAMKGNPRQGAARR